MNKKIFGIKLSTIIGALVCLIAAILFWIIAYLPDDAISLCSDAAISAFEEVRYV